MDAAFHAFAYLALQSRFVTFLDSREHACPSKYQAELEAMLLVVYVLSEAARGAFQLSESLKRHARILLNTTGLYQVQVLVFESGAYNVTVVYAASAVGTEFIKFEPAAISVAHSFVVCPTVGVVNTDVTCQLVVRDTYGN